ncbi:hypothetical protein ARMSODRAFT_452911 [Armillaria solidipes]|uniref:Uncharacterized protein n=1 Tax=Armillaria solidipes TaxID=1076256 RepID=A0A2H3B571_9AGAR|nr:hypothetical protein ARMSODRAFT_452911 [Armillaria solidipes]
MPRLPFTNAAYHVPQRYQHITPVLSQGDVSHSECGTTTNEGLEQLVGGKSMVNARPAPLQMLHDLDTSINAVLKFPAGATRDRGNWGILTYATMLVFGGWDQCRRASTEDEEGLTVSLCQPFPEGSANFEFEPL